MLEAVRQRGAKSVFLRFVLALGGRPSRDALLAAIATTIAWGPLVRKRISRLTAETLPWYLRLYGVMVGASIPGQQHLPGSLYGISREERFGGEPADALAHQRTPGDGGGDGRQQRVA